MVTVSRLLRPVLAVVFGLVTLVGVAAAALTWRLTESPLDVTWLVPRVAPAGWAAQRLTVQIVPDGRGHDLQAELQGGERAATGDEPAQTVRHASVSLALAPLLTGRLAARDVTLEGLRLHLADLPGGGAKAGAGGFDPQAMLSRLQSVRLTDGQVEFGSAALAHAALAHTLVARIDTAQATRAPDGTLQAQATVQATMDGATIPLQLQGRYGTDGGQVQLSTAGVNPSVLARAVPALAALGALDATVSVQADATLGTALQLRQATIHAQTGPGTVQLPAKGGGTAAGHFASVTLDADGTPAKIRLRALTLVLVPASGNPATTVAISGVVDRAGGRFAAHMAVDIDRVVLTDLGSLWPERVGGESRDWLASNLSAGSAHDGHASFTLAGAETGDDLDVTDASGTLTGDDVTIWWLRPVPPVQHAHAALVWQSPDVLLITVTGGRDAGIDAKGGTVRITGLVGHDQVAFIDADLAGGLADVLTLLKNPRLKLLSKHPLPLASPSGAVTAHLSVRLPLEAKVEIDQVAIHATGQVANAHLGDIALGRDLDRGQLALDVTNDGLTISGQADFAHIATQLGVQMDFRGGPGTQEVQHVTATLRLTKADAEKAGLGALGLQAGSVGATVDYTERRDGMASVNLAADLKSAKMDTPLGWSKAAGTAGHAEGRALLDHGRLVGLDGLRAEAPGLAVVARSDLVGGVPSVIHLERAEIGRSSAAGTIVLPQREGEPYRVSLAGPRLDLEGHLGSGDGPAAPEHAESAKPGPHYAVDLRFERVMLGPGHTIGPVTLNAIGTGSHVTTAHLTAGGAEPARLDLVSTGASRRLTASAADLGAVLRETGLAGELVGGAVTIDGSFDDRLAGSPFNGSLDLRSFKVIGAPSAGKWLQALTIYGVLDAIRGPGLAFDRLETQFRLHGSVLDVTNARAFSSSLGFTAAGRMDFKHKSVDLSGTIVPAYFFNSLPGRIPLIGRLFSPEKGSGLFAADFKLTGSLTSPAVSINPLSALTPGFTRRFFDIFN